MNNLFNDYFTLSQENRFNLRKSISNTQYRIQKTDKGNVIKII